MNRHDTTGRGAGGTSEPAPTTQAMTIVQPQAPASQTGAMTSAVLAIGALAAALVAIGALIAGIYKWLTSDLEKRIDDHEERIGKLEEQKASNAEQIAVLKARFDNVERGVERIERGMVENFRMLSDSIREIRHVSPRD